MISAQSTIWRWKSWKASPSYLYPPIKGRHPEYSFYQVHSFWSISSCLTWIDAYLNSPKSDSWHRLYRQGVNANHLLLFAWRNWETSYLQHIVEWNEQKSVLKLVGVKDSIVNNNKYETYTKVNLSEPSSLEAKNDRYFAHLWRI